MWVIIAAAVVLFLVRTHHLSTFPVLVFCALIPSVILHEVSHGWLALVFGDDTAKRAGRLTLNPIPHIDPFGTILLPALLALSGVGMFGWARPVPVNVGRLRHPRNQAVLVSLVGPAVNIALAVAFALVYRFDVPAGDALRSTVGASNPLAGPVWVQFIFAAGFVNVLLAVFNLIPLPPLDGSAVLERLLPRSLIPAYYRIRPFTIFLPLVVVILFPSVLERIFDPALRQWLKLV